LKGSSSLPFPLASQKLLILEGNSLSLAIACNVLGATMIEPNAEDIVAAANPIGIISHPCQAISDMTSLDVFARSVGLADEASLKAMNT
jgi:hypothetical protein